MYLKNLILRLFVFIIFVTFVSSCQSLKPLNEGIQEGYEAINPASIIAVPTFVLPDPSKAAVIDPAIINTHQFIPKLEAKVMEAFKDQPNINGYSFSVVNNVVIKEKSDILNNMNQRLTAISSRFSSRESIIRSVITSSCLSRKNFVEFYSYCVAPDSVWISELNKLALKVLNADTALLVVLKNLDSSSNNDIYVLHGGISLLLVDTNNGKLIWGKDKFVTLKNPPEKKYFPTIDDLLISIFNEEFWEGFPGRIQKNKPKV
ncbi:hypothetical protein QEJ31_06460 [Pigmentibacter sp. JX0631]|uniref:hypothetical protein n=1 Tax=Pigmentibacter sp. JX0631 TaxID=2976982 RepID=UPI002468DF56|nr:hypothetical protein [Pigmentibacter sp. JX0631]WGL61232.1 hypothetical protein QEJ31_06460 [Pigmentibacter sp. JX0631]